MANPLHLAIGFGVEENASPEREILALWQHYLEEPSDSIRATLWSAPERAAVAHYDLVSPYVYQGFTHFTVVDLGPAAGLPDTYVIRTLVSAVDDSTLDVKPLALYRVYAIRENDTWVLANALPRTTREWRRTTIGTITFVCPPSHPFIEWRARATAVFVDSLAAAFGQDAPAAITYYFTDDIAETLRALGVEYFPTGGSPIGGRSNAEVRHAYVGCAHNGEGYRHELCHIILAPEITHATHRLVSEGLMTWLGGSEGFDYTEVLPGVASYLSEHPDVSLESVLTDAPPRRNGVDVGYTGIAALCKMTFDRAGLPGLRALLSAGRDPKDVVQTAAHLLRVSPRRLDEMWRAECGVRK